MKQIYLLSGLGADHRVFEFLDLHNYSYQHVTWEKPGTEESISHYASRLLPQIKSDRPVLIGVSFGGVMATEIGKLLEVEKIILISSVKSAKDLPWISRLFGRLGVHKIIPFHKANNAARFMAYIFGAQNRSEKKLLRSILADTDIDFLRWGLGALMRWNNLTPHPEAVLIHGDNDHVLPHRNADFLVSGGGHFMIVNRAPEISALIRELIPS